MHWSPFRPSITFRLFLLFGISCMLYVSVLWAMGLVRTVDYVREIERQHVRAIVATVATAIQSDVSGLVSTVLTLAERRDLATMPPEQVCDLMGDVIQGYSASKVRGLYIVKADGTSSGYPFGLWRYFGSQEARRTLSQAQANPQEISWSVPHEHAGGTGELVVTIAKPVTASSGLLRYVVAMEISVKAIGEVINNSLRGWQGRVIILDEMGNVVWDRNPEEGLLPKANVTSKTNEEELASVIRSRKQEPLNYAISQLQDNSRWVVAAPIDMKRIRARLNPLWTYGIILGLVLIFGLIVISSLLARWFGSPIKILAARMQQVCLGEDPAPQIHGFRHDELGQLSHDFDEMVLRLHESVDELREMEQQKRIYALRVLQSQINPHFLYNTLNSIDCLVDLGKREEVHQVIRSLVHVLEYGVSHLGDTASLSDEMASVREYAITQQVRYQGRFQLICDCPRELMQCQVLKLILQPLVENAVFHGLRPKKGQGGNVWVAARAMEERLYLTVRDDGVGISPERVATLNEGSTSGVLDPGRHIGLNNVHERIRQHYGSGYGLFLTSQIGVGTQVEITLPLVMGEQSKGGVSPDESASADPSC